MFHASLVTAIASLVLAVPAAQTVPAAPADGGSTVKDAPKSIYDFTVKDIDGQAIDLSRYKGDVLLIVNVASK